jgi:MFS/sugar transport protein
MVPVVGAITDKSTSKWGRRRPFMVWGSVIVSIGLLLLGWTAEIVGYFVHEDTLVRGQHQRHIGRRLWLTRHIEEESMLVGCMSKTTHGIHTNSLKLEHALAVSLSILFLLRNNKPAPHGVSRSFLIQATQPLFHVIYHF